MCCHGGIPLAMLQEQRSLPPEPASALAARAFARDVLSTWREADAADIVTLLVSELVTNAVLHAGSKVEISIRHVGRWLRVEVADGSPVLPGQRDYTPDASTGRGLSLVEALADSWGVDSRGDSGKVVWFEVTAEHVQDVVVEDAPDEITLPEDEVVIRLLNAPVQLFPATQQHTEALLREYALMAMQTDSGQEPPRLVLDTRAVAEQLRAAVEAGRSSADLVVAAPQSARMTVAEASLALDVADQLAADGQLLNAPALPEVRWCREWFLGEVVAQLSGDAPTPWTMAAIRTDARKPLRVNFRAILDRLSEAVVVADDQNHIAYVNHATEDLLGWPGGALLGERLTALIPERLHEAHLAGYTRYQVTRQPRLLGRPAQVPARRYDGSEINIELTINTMAGEGGRQVFVATLRPLTATEAQPLGDGRRWLPLVDAILSAASAAPTADQLVSIVAEHVGWPVGTYWRVEADAIRCAGAWARDPERYEGFLAASTSRTFRTGEGLPGRVCEERAPLWLTDIVRDANFPRMAVALQHGLRSAVAFPVLNGDTIVGVMELFTDQPGMRNDDLLAALTTLGRVLGVTDS